MLKGSHLSFSPDWAGILATKWRDKGKSGTGSARKTNIPAPNSW